MSKICILGDLHFGVPTYNYLLDSILSDYLLHVFFPFLKVRGVTDIIQLGDIFESRKAVGTIAGNNYVEAFLKPIDDLDISLYQILGNHDCFYNQTASLNSPNMFFRLVDSFTNKFHLISKPETHIIDGLEFYMIPWGNFSSEIIEARSEYVCGHFEILDFEYRKDIRATRGYTQTNFQNYIRVFSGHFHKQQEKENIIYPGSLIPLNFGEVDYEHGFYLLDTETENLEWIPNTTNIFTKLSYNPTEEIPRKELIENKVVKIIATNVKDQIKFEQWKSQIETMNPIEVKVATLNIDYPNNNIQNEEIEIFEFLNILKEMCYNINKELNKDKLFELAERIYTESQEEKLR